MSSIVERLDALGIQLPELPKPNGLYRTWIVENGIFSTAGQLSRDGDQVISGPIGKNDDIEIARVAARLCILRCLSVAQSALSSLNEIDSILSLRGFIAATPEFTEHSKVLDSSSELLINLFGDAGQHIRTAVGVTSLPGGGLVEIEMTARIRS